MWKLVDLWKRCMNKCARGSYVSSAQGLRKCVRKRFVTSVGTKKEKKTAFFWERSGKPDEPQTAVVMGRAPVQLLGLADLVGLTGHVAMGVLKAASVLPGQLSEIPAAPGSMTFEFLRKGFQIMLHKARSSWKEGATLPVSCFLEAFFGWQLAS